MREIFSADTRGVSEVVGAVLLLGILILLLTSYQAVVVPNQNAATEFEHNQQVEDEFVDVRNAIIEARSAGRSTFASVKLGAQYQSRILAINPPPPSGTVETTRQVNISVTEGGSGDPLGLDERPLENNFIEYAPRYFEYSNSGTIRFENTVAYHDYGETNVLLTDQTLLRGETVSLIPVEGTFRESGTRRVAIEPMPGVLETVPVEDPEIIVPTELSESDWEQLLENELDDDDQVSVSDGNLTLELDGTYDVAYAPVGVNGVPREGQRGESGSEINMRVDDLTRLQTDNPEFFVSYDVGISHDTVEIMAESTESTASDSATGSDRGGEILSPGFGRSEEFDITVQALSNGDIVAERTITTDADTTNPGANDDMSLVGSPGLVDAETSITDRTRIEQDNPRFRYNWEVDSGDFTEVRLLALSTTTDGASEILTRTQQTGNNVDISLSNGAEEQYKLGILLVDSDGVVVDELIVTDIADNTGP